MRFSLLALLLSLFLAGVSPSQEVSDPEKSDVAEAYLAKTNGDGGPGEAAENFLTTDIPIHCIVKLAVPGLVTVKMDFVAAEVPGVKAETKVVSTSYTMKIGEDRVNFTGRPHGLWVAGKYRVDIYIGSQKVKIIKFEIRKPPASESKPTIQKPSRRVSKVITTAEL